MRGAERPDILVIVKGPYVNMFFFRIVIDDEYVYLVLTHIPKLLIIQAPLNCRSAIYDLIFRLNLSSLYDPNSHRQRGRHTYSHSVNCIASSPSPAQLRYSLKS